MKRLATGVAFVIAALLFQPSYATTFTEIGDAGHTLSTLQTVAGNTTSIVGSLAANDPADVYRFRWDGGIFQAWTSSNFDPMLFIFNLAGNTLAFNDDTFDLQSFVSADLVAGIYLLGINNCCSNYGGDLAGLGGNNWNRGGGYTISISSTAAAAAAASVVPEPSVIALLVLGLLSLVMYRRRKAV